MERLTEKSERGVVWFIDHENNDIRLEPCEMDSHNNRLAIEKLAKYEDLEEQGLIPPCKVGDPVYFIPSKVNYSLNILNGYKENNRVYNQKVAKIVFTERGWHLECDKDLEYGTDHVLVDKFYKETWFFSQAEAEEALKRIGENNETD